MIPCKVINSRELLLILLITLTAHIQESSCDEDNELDPSPEIKLYTELRQQCLTKLNVTTLHDQQTLSNLACMDRCILEKVGIITADGRFHTENIPTDIRQVAVRCDEETRALEPCQRAQSYNLCVFKAVGVRVLAEVCANETNVAIDWEALPSTMMNLTDGSLRCYNRCMLIKMEKIDARNNINGNLLKIYANDAEKVQRAVGVCEEENRQEDECERAVQREICVMEKLS